MQVELSIIFVNWNGGKLLCRAVESVIACPPAVEYEVVVIDNASTDDSLAVLLASQTVHELDERGRLRIVKNDQNLGFGRANNQAFALTETPLLFLLNPDTEVTPGSIDVLIATLQSNPRIGAVGPRILNADGSLQISVWRNPPTVREILLGELKIYLLLPRRLRGELLLGGHWDHNRRRSVQMLSGAAILARRAMINEVGGFDQRFHVYGEDCEWCLRIVRAGWNMVFEPNAVIFHHGAQSSVKRWTDLQKLNVQIEAGYLFQKLTLTRWQLVTNLMAKVLTSSAQHLWRRVRGVDAPDVALVRQVHLLQLKRALSKD